MCGGGDGTVRECVCGRWNSEGECVGGRWNSARVCGGDGTVRESVCVECSEGVWVGGEQ